MAAGVATRILDGDPTLRESVRRLADPYHALRIYLFGSMARVSAGPESDYDLLIVVRDDAPLELQQSGLAYQFGIRKPADVLVCTEAWLRSREKVVTSLPATIIREGKLLYG